MGEHIPKCHHDVTVRNPLEDFGSYLSQLPESVAGDLKLPLDRGLTVVVIQIIGF